MILVGFKKQRLDVNWKPSGAILLCSSFCSWPIGLFHFSGFYQAFEWMLELCLHCCVVVGHYCSERISSGFQCLYCHLKNCCDNHRFRRTTAVFWALVLLYWRTVTSCSFTLAALFWQHFHSFFFDNAPKMNACPDLLLYLVPLDLLLHPISNKTVKKTLSIFHLLTTWRSLLLVRLQLVEDVFLLLMLQALTLAIYF